MEFYITFGKDKDKNNHITRFNNNKMKLDFSIVITQNNRLNNQREYAYLKAETWDHNIINVLQEGKRFRLGDFYFRFWKEDKGYGIITNWVLVIKSLINSNEVKKEKIDMGELFGETFKEVDNTTTNENETKNSDDPWELDL